APGSPRNAYRAPPKNPRGICLTNAPATLTISLVPQPGFSVVGRHRESTCGTFSLRPQPPSSRRPTPPPASSPAPPPARRSGKCFQAVPVVRPITGTGHLTRPAGAASAAQFLAREQSMPSNQSRPVLEALEDRLVPASFPIFGAVPVRFTSVLAAPAPPAAVIHGPPIDGLGTSFLGDAAAKDAGIPVPGLSGFADANLIASGQSGTAGTGTTTPNLGSISLLGVGFLDAGISGPVTIQQPRVTQTPGLQNFGPVFADARLTGPPVVNPGPALKPGLDG